MNFNSRTTFGGIFFEKTKHDMTLKNHILAVFRGLGQIMLQENALTGFGFFIGIFLGSPLMAFSAVLTSAIGMGTARLLKYNDQEIQSGLYGFSPALVGVAMVLFFQPVVYTWLGILLGTIAAAMVQHWLIQKKIPGFTFPFVLITWILLYLFRHILLVEAPLTPETKTPTTLGIEFLFTGFGQVIFQSGLWSGILFFLAVAVSSLRAALFGLMGSFIGGVFAYVLKVDLDTISMGLMGYNAVLTAIVFSGKNSMSWIWSIVSAMITVVMMLLFSALQLPALTFPFVATTWLVLWLRNLSKKS